MSTTSKEALAHPVKGTIHNWSVVNWRPSPYAAPEQGVQRISGKLEVSGDQKPEYRDDILTSSPVGKRDDCVVTKSGSHYKLGDVDPEYERLFPNAKKRLFDSLPIV